jgi:hypothetical protein
LNNMRVLFILKKRSAYAGYNCGFSSGLYNSAKFCADMLSANGFTVKLVEVTDNNDIDREVFLFRPDVVIIEALWVVPSKFTVLQRLHPSVTWIVRIHSEAPFLSQESIAIDWVSQYPLFSNVYVGVNSLEAYQQFLSFYPDKGLPIGKILYLPTYYPAPVTPYYNKKFSGTTINVACMGAIRTLKDTLIQAMAAMRFADMKGYTLKFNINRCLWETEGWPIYLNVVNLFKGTKHTLVQYDWMTHEQFILFLSGIDLSMQVSFSETFCIVAADSVASGVPTVGSPTIRWLDPKSQANTISVSNISGTLIRAIKNGLFSKNLIKTNLKNLQNDAALSQKAWLTAMNDLG